MELEKYLLKLGFSQKETGLYEAIIENAPISITELAKLSGLKRTSLYHLLEKLKNFGFIETTIRGKRKLFVPAEPERLKKIEANKEEELDATKKLVEKLIASVAYRYGDKGFSKPKVRFFQGPEEIKGIMEDALNCKSKEYWYLGSIKLLEELYPQSYWQKFIKRRNERGVKSHSLINRDDSANYKYNDPLREVRVLPEGNNFGVVVVVYDNKFGVISSKKENYAFVVENQELVNVFKLFIKIAWGISSPLHIRKENI